MSWPVVLGMGYKKIETKFQVLVSCQCIITSSFYARNTPKSSIMCIPFALQSQYLHRLCISLAKHYHCIKSCYYIILSAAISCNTHHRYSGTVVDEYMIVRITICYFILVLDTAHYCLLHRIGTCYCWLPLDNIQVDR